VLAALSRGLSFGVSVGASPPPVAGVGSSALVAARALPPPVALLKNPRKLLLSDLAVRFGLVIR